ncbi:MAG: nucleotide exchange factor GrpE [Planctomycetes bacterium]|nr:nucleotide exchange factor GrpE [Planctomycetota bacterium]
MLQKCTILGLVLLLAGGAAFGWLYNETQKERREARRLAPADSLGSQEYMEKYGRWYQLSLTQQSQLVLELNNQQRNKSAEELSREQQARLNADLDKLAEGQKVPADIVEFLYGHGWESQVEEYRQHRGEVDTAQTISIVCLSIGGVLFGSCAIFWLLRLVIRAIQAWKNRSAEPETQTEPAATALANTELSNEEPPKEPETPAAEEQPKQRRRLLTLSETAGESPSAGGAEPGASASSSLMSIDDLFNVPPGGKGPHEAVPAVARSGSPSSAILPKPEDSGVALLLADEDSRDKGWSPEAQWSLHSAAEGQRGAPARDPLKEQTDDLQKQIAEFKRMAESVQQATREQANPLDNTLKELTQQVSAIREYAANQQNRVEKLQDGYDWGIIRTFCLRVIRCVDNLENRLANLPKGDSALTHLEEIKDELLFALESSGVEQFQPELNSEFHGQEKLAEALKEKQPTKKPEQAGRIARVIRPGYRYLIDDENYRVVRTAQVKLYG